MADGFGAADVLKLVTASEDGLGELILGALAALTPHLSDDLLGSLAAVVNGEIADRADQGLG